MSYSIEVTPDDRAVVAIMNSDFSVQQDMAGYAEELKITLDQLPRPVILITDINSVEASFGDIVAAMGLLTQGKLAVLSHPNIQDIIVVTTRDLYTISARALGQAQYGGRRVVVTKTMEEALAYARQQIASG